MKTVWFDITNTPHVHFLKPFIDRYRDQFTVIVSVRDYSETVSLAHLKLEDELKIIGRHGGSGKIGKVRELLSRLQSLKAHINGFDCALSCGGFESCLFAKMKRKVSIVFDDNDISPNWMYARFADHLFFPDAVTAGTLTNQGFKASSIHQYRGYKEDIYLADYEPDMNFISEMPFKDYVVVRPENLMASYLGKGTRTIVPDLLRLLSAKGYYVLYLPRASHEYRYAYGVQRVFIPRYPLNGLDACFFSRAVLSGAGSLTREAACLGRPAVTFYAGKRLLAVDQRMIDDGWILHSRNPDEIVESLKNTEPRQFDSTRSKEVQDSVFNVLDAILLR
jgi:predicted glycosyltransferase